MASITGKVKKVTHINSGVISTLKQPQVQAKLQQQAKDMAASCNSMMSPTFVKKQGEYRGIIVDREHYAAGLVYTANIGSILDNAYHNTLKKGCNV